MNTDTILQSQDNIFEYMLEKWNPEIMDFLLLMQPYNDAVGYSGHGDFELCDDGKLTRPDIEGNYSYLYSGLQILKPQLVAKNPQKIFSLREYYLNSNKVYGVPAPHMKLYHASHPEDVVDIEFHIMSSQ
jgi:MurNAc alpha-1-phosphate uridylyltransferase